MGKINIAFAGCGFLGLYHTGVVAALHTHGLLFLENVHRISGSSSGALHAAMLACNSPLDQCVNLGLNLAQRIRSNKHSIVWQNLDLELREAVDKVLPADAHISATSKLYVSVTVINTSINVRNELISTFNSKDELVDVLANSCYIPFYSGFTPPKTENGWAIDGAYTDNLPYFEGYENVRVSPFIGQSAEISPKGVDESAYELVINNMPFSLSTQNLKRIYKTIIPPSDNELKSLFVTGYQDTKRFLKKQGYFEIGEIPNVQELFYNKDTNYDR